MEIIRQHQLLDTILELHQASLKTDFQAYKNHCYRVLNFYAAFVARSPDNLNKGAVAVAFHDLGIWTDGTLDYLPPSIKRAEDYLVTMQHSFWQDDVHLMIDNHHKITPFHNNALVEGFRKADWLDVSLGMLAFGLNREFISTIQRQFPDEGFHLRLVQLSIKNTLKHPLRPLPIFKW